MERLFLIDGMAIAYRAYFAFINRPLKNKEGLNTSAVYGFVSTLFKILDTENPEHIAVAFDSKEPTFRHKKFPEYKATRQVIPDDLIPQLGYLKEVVEAMNIPVLEIPGWEADDIIGTLARKAENAGYETYMVTPDKDFMQLVSDRIKLYRPSRAGNDFEIIDEEGVRKKFGVSPQQVIDVLGLMGDASDNIPGVKGIGEKTAIPLVRKFGSIPDIYEHLDEIDKKSLREKLESQKEQAFLSRELVTIATDVPVNISVDTLQRAEPDRRKLAELFRYLEFKRFLERIQEGAQLDLATHEDVSSVRHTYVIVDSAERFEELLDALGKASRFAFDTETTSTNPHLGELVGMSFAVEPGVAWYIPWRGSFNRSEILPGVLGILSDSSKTIVGQNLKYDLLVMRWLGLVTRSPLYDTMIASYILAPSGEHNMDALAERYLGYKPISIKELIGSGKKRITMDQVPVEKVAEYAAEDADVTLRLERVLKEKLAETNQLDLLEKIEFPLIHVLTDMEAEGVRIDEALMDEIRVGMEAQIKEAEGEIFSLAGKEFNIASTQQLGKVLFEELGLPAVKKTKTGFSTDASVLEQLKGKHPIIDAILVYRQMTKLKSTYIDALPKLINPKTGRVHTSYNQAIASTGRLSSSDPNLQNIPIRTEAGREIRKAFVPRDENHVLLSADYSQIELRIAAELSGDEALLEAFRKGEDIHASTACRLYGVAPGDVDEEMRRYAKTVNFGILYGISAYGLARRLGISNQEAQSIIDRYFESFPKVNEYIASTLAFARENGYVQTLMGRRRYLPDINNKNRTVRQFAERTAINMPIQGTAADMIKIAMINIHRELEKKSLRAKMILQVHDELVFDTPRDEVEQVKPLVIDLMKNAIPLSVPVEVSVGIGENWLEAH